MLKKVTNYLRNVGKSLGYALNDVVQEDASEIKSFLDTNSHIIRDAYKAVKDYRTSVNKVESSFKNSKIYVAADIGIKAVFEDLANGTFYNKERENEIDAKYSGFDMSDDFDLEAFEKGLKERDKNLTDGDKAIVESVEKANRQSASLISDTIARTTSANIQNQRAASRLLYLQNTQIINGVRAGVDTLNEVGKTINVSNAMFKTIADNQKQFFTDTSKVLKEMHAMQKELLEMQRNVYEDKRQAELSKQRNKRKGYNDVFDSSGVMDLEAYGEIVKENFNRALSESEVGGLFTGMGLGKDSNLLASFAASPLKMLTQSFVKNLIPKVTREATQSLNATFSGLFGTMIGRLNNMATNENSSLLMQTLGKIFGVKPKSKTDVQTNKFQKGPVPFDGIVKKAIVDVIPGYLRRIEAALTGREGRIYDYDSGKWTALNNYIDTKQEMIKSSKRRATGDFRAAIDKYKKRFIFENEDMEKEFNDFFDAVMLDIGSTGNWTRYARAAKPGNEGLAGSIANSINPGATYGADYVRIIGEMMRQAQKYNKTEFRGAASNLAGNIARAQEQLSRTLEDLELKSSPILTALEEGNKDKTTKTDVRLVDKHGAPLPNTVASSVLKTRDKYDKDVFDYLRSLDINAEWMRNFAENGGFGSGRSIGSGNKTYMSREEVLRRLAAISNNRYMRSVTDSMSNEELVNLIRQYGDASIDLDNSVIYSDPDELRRMLKEKSGSNSDFFEINEAEVIRRLRTFDKSDRRRSGIRYMPGRSTEGSSTISGISSFSDIIARRESEYNKDRDRTEEALRREEKEKKSKAHQDRLNEYRNRGYQVVSPRDLGGDSGFSVYGEYTAPLEQMYMTDEAKKKNAPKEQSLWEELWGIRPFTVLDDEDKGVKDFFTRLKDAKSIGDKFTVIKQSTEKLAAAPMTMLTKVIQKADEAVYHFMFADQDDDRDEDDQHPKGLMHKIVTEIKKTFAKLNEWINEKLLDPIKNWFQKKGINKPSDVLDKLTGGSYSDIKEAIASTIFGEKNQDGKREGGWAQPFREAFGYNADKAKKAFKEWDEVKKQREKDKEEKQKRRDIEYNRDDRDEEDIIEDERMHAMAQGTSGVTKTDIYTMLSEGEYVTDPFGKKTRVSKADEMYPHKILKGSLIENPAGRAKRNAQEKNEILRREQFFNSIGVNADAADTTAFRDYERVLFPGGAQEKMEFLAIANGLEDRINDQINETGQDEGRISNLYDLQDRWYKLAPNYQAIKNPLPAGMTRSDYMSFITKNKCKDVINFVRKATQYLDKLVNYRDLDNIRNVSAQDMIADAAKQKPIDPEITIKGLDPSKNQWIKKQLSKVHYGTGDETKDRRVRGIADTTAKSAFGALGGLLVGNPLLGAGIGLLTGIAKNNKEMNTFLFGEGDEDGIISKKTQETFRKAAPDIKKLGIGGAVAGLLTGLGPIPGILLGGALGFAKNNNELMETLFGPEEERAEKFKKFKEEALPRMGIGAAAGALLGPFGLLGGALLGSGAGLLTTTNTFKDIMFGDEDKDGKRHGGIMGALKESFVDPLKSFAQDFSLRAKEFIRDNIVDPIKGAMKPLANAAKHIAVDAIKFVPRLLDKVFTNFLGIPLGDTLRDKVLGPLGRLAKNIIGAPAWLAKQLLKLPGTIIGGIGNAVRASQIRRGRAEYMSAEERLNWRDEHQGRFRTGGLYSLLHPIKSRRNANSLEMDQRLAHLDDKGAEQAYNDLNILLDTEKSANKAFRKSRHDMNVFIDERFRNHGIISTKNNKDKILKKLQDGKIDEALKLISTLKDKNGNKLSGDDLVEFEEKLREYYDTFMEMKERKNLVVSNSRFNKDSVIAGLEDYVKKSGIKGFNLKTRAGQEHLRALLKKEKDIKPGIKDDENHKNGALLDPDEVHQNKMNTMFLQAMHNIVGVTKVMADSIGVYDKDPEAYRKISEGVNTVYGDVKDIENKLDENGNPVDPGLSEVAHKVAKSMEPRMFKANRAARKADKIHAKHTAKGEILKSSRSEDAIKLGYDEDTEATSLWSSDDPRVNKVFDIAFTAGNKIDINAALGAASIKKNGKFTDNLELACRFARGGLIDAERIGIIAKIEHSTTMPNAFKKANAYSIPLFNSDIFQSKDQIMAVLGVSEEIMNRDTYKDALKEIKHRCDVYGYAPSAAEIKAIFNDVSARKNSTAATNKFAERTKGFSQAQIDQAIRESVFDQVPEDDASDMTSSGSIEDIITTNAHANHLSRFVKTNATIGELAQPAIEREKLKEALKDPKKRKEYYAKRKQEKIDEKIRKAAEKQKEKEKWKGIRELNAKYKKEEKEARQYRIEHEDEVRASNLEKINEYINNNTTRSQSELEAILYELKNVRINTDIDLAIAKQEEKDRKDEQKKKEKEEKQKEKQSRKKGRAAAYKDIKWWNVPGKVRQWLKFRKEDFDEGVDNLNKKVMKAGETVADKGNSIFEALSHPIKTIKAGIKGSKEAYEKSVNESKHFSFFDKIDAMVQGQKEQIQLLKEKDKQEGKTPWIKKIFQFIFGKTLGGFFGKVVAVPLVVGAYKKFVKPFLKNTIGPWLYDKLWGDPNRDDDGLLGKLGTWFKKKVVPTIFGEKDENGVWNKGLFSGLANWWDQTASPFLFGTKNDDGTVKDKGLIGNIKDMFLNLGEKIRDGIQFIGDFLLNRRHMSNTFGQHDFDNIDKGSSGLLKMLAETWAEGATTIVPWATELILKTLPNVVGGIVQGIGNWLTGNNSDKADEAVERALGKTKSSSIIGSATTSANKDNLLATIETDDSVIDRMSGASKTIANEVDNSKVASGGTITELLDSGKPIYNNGKDISEEIAEINEIHQSGTDKDLDKAIELAKDNLVILPPSMFGNDYDAYKEYLDAMLGEGATEEYGWEFLQTLQDPTLIPQDSEAYKRMKERWSIGKRIEFSLFKLVVSGGLGCKALPALARAGSKILNLVAKIGFKLRGLGYVVGAAAKIGSVGAVTIGTISSSARLAENYAKATALGKIANKTNDAAKIAKVTAKADKAVVKAGKAVDSIKNFFSSLFEDSRVLGKIANVLGKPVNWVKGKLSGTIIEKLATSLGGLVSSAAKTAGKAIGTALPLIKLFSCGDSFVKGFFDAPNILGYLSRGEKLNPLHCLMAGFLSAMNELLLFGLIPTYDLCNWIQDAIFIGVFDVETDITERHRASLAELNRYNEANNTDLTLEEYASIYYPTAKQMFDKDFFGGNFEGLWNAFLGGWRSILNGTAFNNFGTGKEFGNTENIYNNNTYQTINNAVADSGYGKGHIDQRASNMRYNAPGDTIYQTVADSGCGPAAAATVLSRFGKGKVEEAAQYSLDNGYKEPNGGTYPGFFGDYLGQNGIETQYETTTGGVIDSLKRGNPVILMGSESGRGTTPYAGADGSHYVTATGLDRHGNMIIEDPDDRRGARKYKAKNVLNKTSLAISTRAGSGKKYGKSRRGYKVPKTMSKSPIFGKGGYSYRDYDISEIDRDGLQDLRLWKDPGTGNDRSSYIDAIGNRIYKGAVNWENGLMRLYPKEIAEAAVYAGEETGLDPAILIAIGIYESGWGVSDIAKNDLNFWGWNVNTKTLEAGEGWTVYGNSYTLQSFKKAFLTYAKALSKNYYDNGQTCLYKMVDNGGRNQYPGTYDQLAKNWAVNVAYYMKAIHDAVGQTDENMSWHPKDGKAYLLTDILDKFYKTKDGYTGVTGTDTTPSNSGDGRLASSKYGADSSSGGATSFLDMIKELGSKILKGMFGGVYDLLFGTVDSSDNSSSNSNGYYDENGNYINTGSGGINPLNSTNAADWFLKTIPNSKVTSTYGYSDPDYVYEGSNWHRGIDIANGSQGSDIVSPIDGKVEWIGERHNGYGYYAKIKDKYNENLHHIFGHMINNSGAVNIGDEVTRGTIIGKLGKTGGNWGAHLHYEIDKDGHLNKAGKNDINPDTDYDWSKYVIDEDSGEYVKDITTDELIRLQKTENNDFITRNNEYKRIDYLPIPPEQKEKSRKDLYAKYISSAKYAEELRKRRETYRQDDPYGAKMRHDIDEVLSTIPPDIKEALRNESVYKYNPRLDFIRKNQDLFTDEYIDKYSYGPIEGLNKFAKKLFRLGWDEYNTQHHDYATASSDPNYRKLDDILTDYINAWANKEYSKDVEDDVSYAYNWKSYDELTPEEQQNALNGKYEQEKRVLGQHLANHGRNWVDDDPVMYYRIPEKSSTFKTIKYPKAPTFDFDREFANSASPISSYDGYKDLYFRDIQKYPDYYDLNSILSPGDVYTYNEIYNDNNGKRDGNIYRNILKDSRINSINREIKEWVMRNEDADINNRGTGTSSKDLSTSAMLQWYYNKLKDIHDNIEERGYTELSDIVDRPLAYDYSKILEGTTNEPYEGRGKKSLFGKGKSSNQGSYFKQIMSAGLKAEKADNETTSKKAIMNLAQKTANYVKKFKTNPFASESSATIVDSKGGGSSFGTGKRPVIKNAYGKATPTMTQVKLRPQTTTKTEVKVEAPTNNIGLSQLNYTKFLITIIEALGKIADNTEKLDKVIMLLKTNGPKLGIDTSGLGKAKTNAEKLSGITSSLRNHKIDPSWGMAAMDRNNDFNPADAFMENIYRLASE